jgi:hypothetical protein
MPPAQSSIPDAFATCLDSALAQGPSVIQRTVVGAARSLEDSAATVRDNAERNLLVEARQVLLRKQDSLTASFPEALAARVAEASNPDSRPAAAIALDFDSLELMAEEQVDDTVELLRAQQTVATAVETEIVQLNALVSASRGLRVVRASDNPLLPEVWVKALRDSTLKCNVSDVLRLRWMQHLAAALGQELVGVYRHVSTMLKQEGVAAASFGVNQAPQRSAVPVSREQGSPAPEAARSAGAGTLTLRDLRRLLAGDGAGRRPAEEAGADSRMTQGLTQGLTVPAAFEALKELEQAGRVFQRMRERHAAGAWKGAPGADAGSPAQQTPAQTLSREVVSLMVDNIAADPRLLEPVVTLVRQLEPALLRLALADPRFFSDKAHPARILLDEMTTRSLGWSSPSAAGFVAFMEPLRQAVQALADMPLDSAEPFVFALDTLRQVWNDAEEKSRRARATTAKALQKAETRNIAAGKIAGEMQERPDMAGATAEVRRFLMGPWCQVMAAARLAGPSGKPKADEYEALVNDLIWSTQRRLTATNPARLAKLLPPMLATLRAGLESIEYPVDATEKFFERLAEVHQDALRPLGAPLPERAAPPAPAEADDAQADAWLSASEAQASSLMQLVDSALVTNFDSTVLEARAAGSGADAPPLAIDKLAAGAYVEVLVKGSWVRWRLAWISSQSLLFMFTNGAGKPESMTRQMLERMAELGAVRLLSDRSVVTGALDAVAQAALRNSMLHTTI